MPSPIFNIDLLHVADILEMGPVAASIEEGRSFSGMFGALDFSGGGVVRVGYGLSLFNREQHRYYNRMRAYLAGSVNTVAVPLMTDWFSPFARTQEGIVLSSGGIPHSDGTLHTDDTGYTQAPLYGSLNGTYDVNEATIVLRIDTPAGALEGGEVFSIFHPGGKEHRAYWITEIDDVDGAFYTVGIRPTLREDTLIGADLRFDRPLVTCRLAPGPDNMPYAVSDFATLEPPVIFIEAP